MLQRELRCGAFELCNVQLFHSKHGLHRLRMFDKFGRRAGTIRGKEVMIMLIRRGGRTGRISLLALPRQELACD
jgi:hypothetical protein